MIEHFWSGKKKKKSTERAFKTFEPADPLVNGVVRLNQHCCGCCFCCVITHNSHKEDVTNEIIISWVLMNRVKLWAKFSQSTKRKNCN